MEGYLGEIRMWGPPWAPENWVVCKGQLLYIKSHEKLFNIIGTIYGGDGRNSFGIPDLRGRAPVNYGIGKGSCIEYNIGQKKGSEFTYLKSSDIPRHSHQVDIENLEGHIKVNEEDGDSDDPNGKNIGLVVSESKNNSDPMTSIETHTYLYNSQVSTAKTADIITINDTKIKSNYNPYPDDKEGTDGKMSYAEQTDVNIMQPTLAVSFIMCIEGKFPERAHFQY